MNLKDLSIVITFIIFLIIIFSCDGGKMPEDKVTFPSIKDVPVEKWRKLLQKKIYFGHRSVGNNIINGIADLMKEHPEIKLNIVQTADISDFNIGLFAHSHIGENGNPMSKIDEFEGLMEQGIGSKANVAFFKFCFADIKAKTDVRKVFANYINTMSRLKQRYTGTVFVHVTVPLGTSKTTWKTWIKKLMGKKEIWEYDHNVARNEFNDLLKNEYEGKEPIFDLAEIESTYANGRQSLFEKNGITYESLVPEYTHDGGHLNEEGRKIVAGQFLIFLANLENK